MQNTGHQASYNSDESSAASASDIINIEPVSTPTHGATTSDLLVLGQPAMPSPKSCLSEPVREHAQLLIGLLLGVAATLALGKLNSTSSAAATFAGLSLSQPFFRHATTLALTQFGNHTRPTPVDIDQPTLAPAPIPPPPQLQFVDRYYLIDGAYADGSAQSEPAWFMVDRFYFTSQPAQGASSFPQPIALNRQSQTAAYPSAHPPSWPSPPASWLPPEEGFQSVLRVPPPPDFDLATGLDAPASPPDLSAETPQPTNPALERHTLLGVVATNSFGAALIKTHDNSYSVRVGEPIRQSRFVLARLDGDKAVLSDGQQTLVINVGESF